MALFSSSGHPTNSNSIPTQQFVEIPVLMEKKSKLLVNFDKKVLKSICEYLSSHGTAIPTSISI
jgi:hypothetical protein